MKQDIIDGINTIPEFRFRQVAVEMQTIGPLNERGLTWQPVSKEWRAITTINSTEPLSFVSARYQLMQFKEAFMPLVQDLQEADGKVLYADGFAVMDVFPDGPEYVLSTGDRVGITAYNSVTRTAAMQIKMCIKHDGRHITLPRQVSGFYKAHVGKISDQTKDYQDMIMKIKETWGTVMKEFQETEVTEENFDDLTAGFDTDPRILKALKLEMHAASAPAPGNSSGISGVNNHNEHWNLWSLAMEIYDRMEKKGGKNDVLLRKRLDNFINTLISWSRILTI